MGNAVSWNMIQVGTCMARATGLDGKARSTARVLRFSYQTAQRSDSLGIIALIVQCCVDRPLALLVNFLQCLVHVRGTKRVRKFSTISLRKARRGN